MLVATETIRFLLCKLADEHYGLSMDVVREVLRWRTPTPIPGTPQTVIGMLHHRGAILPVLDVRSLLGIGKPLPTRSTRIIVVEQGAIQAGIIGDAVADIVYIDDGAVEPLPSSLPAAQAQYLSGLVTYDDQPVALLDLPAIFATITAEHDAR
ncbi:MAG TPA: chemotaxis protein CheW [Herpetosiphonaceae bacterium]